MNRKEIYTVFKENHYKIADADSPIFKWLGNEEKNGLPENLKSVFISANEDELYFVFDCKDKEIQAIEDSSKDVDNMISVFVNFGNYENTKKFRYNIFQILLIDEDQELDDKICKKLKESTNATRKIFLRSKGLSVNDEDLFLLPFWFDNQHESGVFNKESMPELEGVPEFLTKKYEDKHEFSDNEIEKVREWLEV